VRGAFRHARAPRPRHRRRRARQGARVAGRHARRQRWRRIVASGQAGKEPATARPPVRADGARQRPRRRMRLPEASPETAARAQPHPPRSQRQWRRTQVPAADIPGARSWRNRRRDAGAGRERRRSLSRAGAKTPTHPTPSGSPSAPRAAREARGSRRGKQRLRPRRSWRGRAPVVLCDRRSPEQHARASAPQRRVLRPARRFPKP
jgi:hypothetical protein